MEPTEAEVKPSWLKWPPNCCETCMGGQRIGDYEFRCSQNLSVNCGDIHDSRFRCQDFVRRKDVNEAT